MLVDLQVRNYGLIDSISVEFGEGMNVLSGETGVGKSMVISALKFLLGARVPSKVIRKGESEAAVTATFFLSPPAAAHIGEVLGEDFRNLGQELLLQRTIHREGRNRCLINDRIVTLTCLRVLAGSLVDIHGQHEELSLLSRVQQRGLLDRFGQCDDLKARFRASLLNWRTGVEKRRELRSRDADRQRELGILRHQVEEIRSADMHPGEFEELKTRQEMLTRIEEILDVSGRARSDIQEEDSSIVSRLSDHLRNIDRYRSLHTRLEDAACHLEEASECLRSAVDALAHFCDQQEYDAGEVERIESRLDAITDLRMKYGRDEVAILAFAESAARRISGLEGEERETEESDGMIRAMAELAETLGEDLHRKRMESASTLARTVTRELRSLGMPQAKFDVHIERAASLETANEDGLDAVTFGFCANPGEDLRPLAEVASGGELSRILLAIKNVLAAMDPVPVLIFDEIDANIGGRMGNVVGDKLAQLSTHHQIICVTHLPQIASYASRHIRLSKTVNGGRTRTLAESVTGTERIEEIAAMIRGTGVTRTTLEQAREMLEEAQARHPRSVTNR